MKRLLIIIQLGLFFIPLQLISQTPISTQSQKRIALVIGNGNYLGSTLANPENDARAMRVALQNVGFTVLEYENLNQSQMKQAIDDFGLKLKDYDVGLFFYAGHGIQAKGYNYLIPVDAQLLSEAEVEYECVQADRILAKMEGTGTDVNIIILDACRNNPFERAWTRSTTGSGLAFMNAPKGTLIAYATSPGSTASDGSGRNGLYTSAILQSITIPNITIIQMFQQVRSIVNKASNEQQTPWESTSLIGDFYFNDNKISYNKVITESVTDSNLINESVNNLRIPPDGIMITSFKKEEIKSRGGNSVKDSLYFVTLNKGEDYKIKKNNYLGVFSTIYIPSVATGILDTLKDKIIGYIDIKNSYTDKSEGILKINNKYKNLDININQSYAKLKRSWISIFIISEIATIKLNPSTRISSLGLGCMIGKSFGGYFHIASSRFWGVPSDTTEIKLHNVFAISGGITKSLSARTTVGFGLGFIPNFGISFDLISSNRFGPHFQVLYGGYFSSNKSIGFDLGVGYIF